MCSRFSGRLESCCVDGFIPNNRHHLRHISGHNLCHRWRRWPRRRVEDWIWEWTNRRARVGIYLRVPLRYNRIIEWHTETWFDEKAYSFRGYSVYVKLSFLTHLSHYLRSRSRWYVIDHAATAYSGSLLLNSHCYSMVVYLVFWHYFSV